MRNKIFALVALALLSLQVSAIGQDPNSRQLQPQSPSTGTFAQESPGQSQVVVGGSRRRDIWDRPHGSIVGKVDPETRLNVLAVRPQGELTWYKVSGDMYSIFRPRRPLDTGWISSLAVTPLKSKATPTERKYEIVFYAYGSGTQVTKPDGSLYKSGSGHAFVGFYINGETKIVQGFGPDGASLFFASQLSVQNYLPKFASHSFTKSVTAEAFKKAILIEKKGYGILVNDCVTYADDVADAIGLSTPAKIDFVITPTGFLEYISAKNTP